MTANTREGAGMGEDPQLSFGLVEFKVPVESLKGYQADKWVYWFGAQKKIQGRGYIFRGHQPIDGDG